MLNISLTVFLNTSVFQDDESIENSYQNLYKKILQFYYAHPKYKIALNISGPALDFINKKHPEYTQLLSELTSRKQLEILGGGYYNPAFPLLFPQDRSGQLEMMTLALRKSIGKRPRGLTLVNSIWDSSIISTLQTCGMEYVLLDSSLIPADKNEMLPLIICDQGKSIKVLPVYRETETAVFDDTSVDSYISNIFKIYKKNISRSSSSCQNRGVCLNISETLFKHLFNSGWIESFYKIIEEDYEGKIQNVLPVEYIHSAVECVPAYIPSGMRSDIAQWAKVPYTKSKIEKDSSVSIQDFLLTYSQNHTLYNRMLYMSMLINQAHGDKARRKMAREFLWHAQAGEAYVCTPDGIFANGAVRQQCYKFLTEAEKLLRECNPKDKSFKECVTSYDYNGDGYNEYICRMNNYTACISPKGAQITELDLIRNSGNYVDNLNRVEKFDGIEDSYERGLFVEHLFTEAEFKDYKKGLPAGNGIFSRTRFNQLNFDAGRHEVKLIGHGEFSNLKLPVSLRKKYIANSNGFMIQFILKNESPLPLKGHLVVENNFAQTDFTNSEAISYKVEVITIGERNELEILKKGSVTKAVSYVQITDNSNDISFVFEPNEDGDYFCQPVFFKRPASSGDRLKIAGNTLVSSLSWNVDLAPGMEMEKTINFSMIVPKKRRNTK